MYISHLLTARFSDSKQEKEDFHSKAKMAWKFLTQATGIVDPTTFQVSNPSEAMEKCINFEKKIKNIVKKIQKEVIKQTKKILTIYLET